MKSNWSLSLLISFTVLSTSVQAQWAPRDIAAVGAMNSSADWILDPYWASLWDNLRLKIDGMWRPMTAYPGMQKITVNLGRNYFLSPDGKTLPLEAFHWQARQGSPSPPPLVVYLPGIFEDQKSADTFRAVEYLLQAGNQVLVIPNPLSDSYLRAYPRAAPTSYRDEAEIVRAVVRAFENENSIGHVHLVGASYGALLAAMATAEDGKRASPLFDETTLFFPPLDMDRSVAILDRMGTGSEYSPAGIIGRLFHQRMVHVVKGLKKRFFLDERFGFVARRYPVGFRDKVKKFDLNRLTFRMALDDLIGNFGADGKLIPWLLVARARGRNIRVFDAADDWINEPGGWRELPSVLADPSHLLLSTTGGHGGMLDSAWFQNFVVQCMQANDDVANSNVN